MKKSTKSKIKKHLIVLKNKQSKLQVAIDKNHNLIMAFDAAISQCQNTEEKLNKNLTTINDAICLIEAIV